MPSGKHLPCMCFHVSNHASFKSIGLLELCALKGFFTCMSSHVFINRTWNLCLNDHRGWTLFTCTVIDVQIRCKLNYFNYKDLTENSYMHEHAENLKIYHSACEQGSASVLIQYSIQRERNARDKDSTAGNWLFASTHGSARHVAALSPRDNPFFLDAQVHDVISSGARQNRYSSMTALIEATSWHGVPRELIYASSVSRLSYW